MSWLFFATLGSATVNTIYTYWGYYNICHLREIATRRKYSAGDFSSIIGIAVLCLVMQTSILGVLPWQQAQDSPFIVSVFIEKLYGSGAAKFATAMICDRVCARRFRQAHIRACRIRRRSTGIFQRVRATAFEKRFPHVALFSQALTSAFARCCLL